MGDDTSGYTYDHWYGERTDRTPKTSVHEKIRWPLRLGLLLALALTITITATYGSERAFDQAVPISGLLCDKPEQVKTFLKDWDGNPNLELSNTLALIQKINAEGGFGACGLAIANFSRVIPKGPVQSKSGVYLVVEGWTTNLYYPTWDSKTSYRFATAQFFFLTLQKR